MQHIGLTCDSSKPKDWNSNYYTSAIRLYDSVQVDCLVTAVTRNLDDTEAESLSEKGEPERREIHHIQEQEISRLCKKDGRNLVRDESISPWLETLIGSVEFQNKQLSKIKIRHTRNEVKPEQFSSLEKKKIHIYSKKKKSS